MKPADEDKLRELADTVVADAGVGLDFEDMIIVAAGRRRLIRVVVDGDAGVSLDAAAEVSRALAAALDTDGDALLGPEPYTLEVTSPGVGRPLTEERHFRRARGRLLTAKMFDGSTVTGRVRRLVGDALELLTSADTTTVSIPLADIRRAKVDVEFAAVPAVHAELLAADGFVDHARAFDADEADSADLEDKGDDELDLTDLVADTADDGEGADLESDNDVEGAGTAGPAVAREGQQ